MGLKQIILMCVGIALILVGVPLLILPGPGLLFIGAGVWVIISQFRRPKPKRSQSEGKSAVNSAQSAEDLSNGGSISDI
jgi:hypothetical protein